MREALLRTQCGMTGIKAQHLNLHFTQSAELGHAQFRSGAVHGITDIRSKIGEFANVDT
jgi:hypothetical protein